MTPDRELREAAIAATKQGRWFSKEYLLDDDFKGMSPWDARYIALASPSVVLALLDRVEKLEAEARRRACLHPSFHDDDGVRYCTKCGLAECVAKDDMRAP